MAHFFSMLSTLKHLRVVWLWLAVLLCTAAPAYAHDPFDGNIQMIVFDDRIEGKVTLGYDAARAYLRAARLPARDIARITRVAQGKELLHLPLPAAARLLALQDANGAVLPTAFLVAPNDNEINFLVIFPRPAASTLVLRAPYFADIEDMRPGTVVVATDDRKILLSALVTKAQPAVTIPLAASTGAPAVRPGFTTFFKLGIEHILTGYDHLLFLGALLITMRRTGPMLGMMTAFTVAHSITLALAALDVVTAPAAVIEPLIAASIIAVCVGNFVRRDVVTDRYWMAGVFGLIHGFGFAGILRETALAETGTGLVAPLLAFNLGVETGQLMVAALFIPLLLLLRRVQAFERYGTTALSVVVIVTSSYWLIERLQPA
jgi:hypothetical protein